MSDRQQRLQLRRQALQTKIQAQRQLFRLQTAELRQNLAVTELGWQFGNTLVNKVRQQPWLGALAGAALTFVGPRRIFNGARTGLRLWRLWRSVAPLFGRGASQPDTVAAAQPAQPNQAAQQPQPAPGSARPPSA